MNWKQAGLLVIFSCTATYHLTAQKNYTMEEAVLGLGTHLRIEDMSQLSFKKNSTHYQQVVDSYMIVTNGKGIADTLVSLAQINALISMIPDKVKRIPPIKWLSENEFYYQIKNDIYKGTQVNKQYQLTKWQSVEADAENIVINEKNGIITYTIDNNLKAILPSGVKAITADADKNIVNGAMVHRSEFGIDRGVFQSPNGNFVAYYRMDQSMVADYPIIDWKANPAQNHNIKYPMAGGITHEVNIGVYDIRTDKTVYLKTPLMTKDYYLTCVTWSPDDKHIYIAVLNRNQRFMELQQYDAVSGDCTKILFTESDTKYVEPQNPLYFLPEGREFVWWSQRDGYMHLYRYTTEGKLLNQITKGKWIVKSIDGINQKTKELIITTSKGDPRETTIQAVNFKTGKMRQLSTVNGTHYVLAATDGSYLLDIYRNASTPKNISLIDVKKGTSTLLLQAKNPLIRYNNATVENVHLKASDGTELYGKIMYPHDFDTTKKYPIIYYLYNGPHVQLITNSFPETGNLWYDYLTQRGYIVFSMDGRGSSNRGLAFEQAIHNQLGSVEMDDHMQGVRYLKSLPYVDGDKMGIYGWSYGGFMTTSFMTRMPDIFIAGVAGGPVIDWTKYEIMYTERYMSSPQDNPEGYKNNNLVNQAKNLKGKLLLIHGTDDDVVVWQHSIDFVKKCVDENVQIDYFVYPGHPHNVRGKDRVHLMQKITDYFDAHLK